MELENECGFYGARLAFLTSQWTKLEEDLQNKKEISKKRYYFLHYTPYILIIGINAIKKNTTT